MPGTVPLLPFPPRFAAVCLTGRRRRGRKGSHLRVVQAPQSRDASRRAEEACLRWIRDVLP
jgi:hypothetical protein